MTQQKKIVGRIFRGSLTEGFSAFVSGGFSTEDFPIGSLIIVEGVKHRYLGIIIDTGYQTTHSFVHSIELASIPDRLKKVAVRSVESKVSHQWIQFTIVAQYDGVTTRAADTSPHYYSEVLIPRHEDIEVFFGSEDNVSFWSIGIPKAAGGVRMLPVPINVGELVNLSFGIFGKSGTGKTFLGNIIAGLITAYSIRSGDVKPIRLLIFDMHTEYGHKLRDNQNNPIANGVGLIFRDHFIRYTLDPETAKETDLEELRLDLSELTIRDIEAVAPIFDISPVFLSYLPDFKRIFERDLGLKEYWLWGMLLDDDSASKLRGDPVVARILDNVLSTGGFRSFDEIRRRAMDIISDRFKTAGTNTFRANVVKLKQILKYPITHGEKTFDTIIDNLVSRTGKSIIISMGKYEKETPLYMLVANILARKLRDKINEKIMKQGQTETKIVIFLEEAHNFLGRQTYRLSPFGDIAREMRKKGVILCIIDQKPAELDPDVISMLWTNFIFALTDKKDVEATLMGIQHPEHFAKVIPILTPREVLISGLAVRYPVVLEVADYKEFAKLLTKIAKEHRESYENIIESL